MKLAVERTGALVADQIDLADTFWTRFVGLLGRDHLDANQGLLIEPCNSVHTFFMRFAIDVVFLDRDRKVIRCVENLKPWRATKIHVRAHSTLELASGAIARAQIAEGDRLIDQQQPR